MWSKYVEESHYKHIIEFKYSGTCNSILYKYFLSDWAQFIVDRMPKWLAPNVITLTGFAFLLSAFTLTYLYNPNYDQAVPNWLCFYSAFCIFAYQTLDNCDGKQARRTNSSTALGMLIDHGTDCSATWIVGLILLNHFRCEQGCMAFISSLIASFISFFFGVYQQYYTGHFLLDPINAVDEGLPLIQALLIMTGFLGSNWWLQHSGIMDLKYIEVMILFTVTSSLITIFQFGKEVFKQLNWNILKIIISLSLPITLLFTATIICLFSPTNVLKTHMNIYVLLLGFQWAKQINIWQLCIISKQEFNQWKSTSWAIINLALIVNTLSCQFTMTKSCFIDEVQLCWILFIYSFISYVYTVKCIQIQLCEILNIKVFSIKSDDKNK